MAKNVNCKIILKNNFRCKAIRILRSWGDKIYHKFYQLDGKNYQECHQSYDEKEC